MTAFTSLEWLSSSDSTMIILFPWYLSIVLTSVSEREFIEGRRRALGRFINLVARHPFFLEDELVKTFLTFSGSVCTIFGTSRLFVAGVIVQMLSSWWHVPYSITFPKQDVQTKLRDAYKKIGDEFMTNRIATQAKVCHVYSGKI